MISPNPLQCRKGHPPESESRRLQVCGVAHAYIYSLKVYQKNPVGLSQMEILGEANVWHSTKFENDLIYALKVMLKFLQIVY